MAKTLSEIAEEQVKVARTTSRFFTGLACVFLVFNFLFILTLYQMGNRLQVLAQLFVFLQSSQNLVLPEALNGKVSMLDKEPDIDLFSVVSSEFKQALVVHADVVK